MTRAKPQKGLCVDLPVSWLTSTWWMQLGSEGIEVYVQALMWSMSQQEDGHVPLAAYKMLHSSGDVVRVAEIVDVLVALGRAVPTDDGFLLDDWTGKQAQNTADQIAEGKARKAANEKARRDRQKAQRSESGPQPPQGGSKALSSGVVGDHVGDHVSKDKLSQVRSSQGKYESDSDQALTNDDPPQFESYTDAAGVVRNRRIAA